MKDPGRRRRGIIVYSFLIILAVSIFAYLTWALRTLILPIVLGILLAYLFKPLKNVFKYRWIPSGVRIGFLFFVLTATFFSGFTFVKNNFPNQKEKLEILVRMKYHFNKKYDSLMESAPGLYKLVSKDVNPFRANVNKFLDLSAEQKTMFQEFYRGVPGYNPVPEKYYQYFLSNIKGEPQLPSQADGLSQIKGLQIAPSGQDPSFLKILLDIFSIWFLLPIVFLFFLLDNGAFAHFYIQLVPNRYFEVALTVKEEVDKAIGRYLRGISMECGLVGASMALGFFIIGVPLKVSILIGIVSGIGTAVPFLGPIVSLSLGVGFALIAEEIHPLLPFVNADNLLISVLIVTAVVLVLDKTVFQPFVLGGAVDLHPLIFILGLIAGSILFGMAGIILAVPTIVVIKVFAENTLSGLRDYRVI